MAVSKPWPFIMDIGCLLRVSFIVTLTAAIVYQIEMSYYCFSPARGGRQLYTRDEDLALLLFVKEHKAFHPIRGNNLYKEAAKAKVACTESIFIARRAG